MLADWLARDRVELATDPIAVASTSTAQATLGSDGHATYEFDLEWRLSEIWSFAQWLQGPHVGDTDDHTALGGLAEELTRPHFGES